MKSVIILLLIFFSVTGFSQSIDVNDSIAMTIPAKDIATTGTYCFENNGLKYKITIHINFLSDDVVYGYAERNDYGDEKIQTFFTGKIIANKIIVKWKGLPFDPGDTSSWTVYGWKIQSGVLKIPFKSKNYNTGKWVIRSADFLQTCK